MKERDRVQQSWYTVLMGLERKIPETTSQSDTVLGAAASTLESLKQAQNDIAKLVGSGRSYPSWQPECPLRSSDEALERRLDSMVALLRDVRERLIDVRSDLLGASRKRSPFKLPSILQQRLD